MTSLEWANRPHFGFAHGRRGAGAASQRSSPGILGQRDKSNGTAPSRWDRPAMACWRGGEGGSGSTQEPSINCWSSWEVLFLRRCAGRMQSRAMCWSFSCGQLLLRRRWIRWLSWPEKLRRWRALRRAWSKMRRRLLTLCRDQSVRVVVGLSEGGLRRGGWSWDLRKLRPCILRRPCLHPRSCIHKLVTLVGLFFWLLFFWLWSQLWENRHRMGRPRRGGWGRDGLRRGHHPLRKRPCS